MAKWAAPWISGAGVQKAAGARQVAGPLASRTPEDARIATRDHGTGRDPDRGDGPIGHCAFLTLEERGDFCIDDALAIAPLEHLGWRVEEVPWRRRGEDWARFDAVIVRSTWDWFEAPEDFLATLSAIDAVTRLANPIELLRWNLSKSYLRDLEARGVPIVPTLWCERWHADVGTEARERFAVDELVAKPVLGANGEDAFRIGPEPDAACDALLDTRLGGRACMVQPFRPAILEEGEFSTFWFAQRDGARLVSRFGHAIVKRPTAGEFRSQEERGAGIEPVSPEPALLAAATQALAAVTPVPVYARADFLRGPQGDFELMELELLEPSLYLRTDPGAPGRLARAVDDWFAIGDA